MIWGYPHFRTHHLDHFWYARLYPCIDDSSSLGLFHGKQWWFAIIPWLYDWFQKGIPQIGWLNWCEMLHPVGQFKTTLFERYLHWARHDIFSMILVITYWERIKWNPWMMTTISLCIRHGEFIFFCCHGTHKPGSKSLVLGTSSAGGYWKPHLPLWSFMAFHLCCPWWVVDAQNTRME